MSRNARPLVSLLTVSVLLFGLAVPATGQQISNPKLYEKSLTAARGALEYYGELDDPEARRRVNDIGYRLAVVSRFEDFPFSFFVVDMPVPNAFALPGGHVFVTRGMLDLGLSDDMLASLLGHELAHVIYRHGTRMQKRAALLNVLSSALLLGVLVGVDDDKATNNPYEPGYGGRSRKGSMVQGTMAAGMAISELLLRDYSREFEDEADDEGQRLAAAGGFDPDGARQLWELMSSRIPQSQSYGYWRTHPFSDQRMRAARVRAGELKIQEGEPPEDYRAAVQKAILEYGEREWKMEEEVVEKVEQFLELSALYAWPEGPRAETIRLDRLHRRRDAELQLGEMERDYGELVRAYLAELDEVRALAPRSPLVATLEGELDALREESVAFLPKARAIWEGEIYQTPFLETFLSNYPTASEVPDVALVLGNAYSRLGRQTEAVEQFLRAAEAGPESEAGGRAGEGLRNLAPYLEKLAALAQLAESDDPQLVEIAQKRLGEIAPTYEELENGAEYLKRHPEGAQAEAVAERLEVLARNLYGEIVLYQGVGDHVKALERIQLILTHAPLTRAAELLREKAVFDS